MRLSLEIPIPHIEEFLPLTDFPFLLAQHVLDSKYPDSLYGLNSILDNGVYELDAPLPDTDIIEAAKICQPISVIAPDYPDDMRATIGAAARFRGALYKAFGDEVCPEVGAVVQGKNLSERIHCATVLFAAKFAPICFPFRTPRAATLAELATQNFFREDWTYHLLGLSDLVELHWNLPGYWSIDTSKPFKGVRLDKTESIRGHGRLDIDQKLTLIQREIACWNIAYMRRIVVS